MSTERAAPARVRWVDDVPATVKLLVDESTVAG